MDHFQIAQAFIADTQGIGKQTELASAFQHAITALGFRYFACGSHVDPLHPHHAVMLITYPSAWVRCFSAMRLQHIDPVFQYAKRSPLPFFWDSQEFLERLDDNQKGILSEAERFGIAHGYTIQIHSPRAPRALYASCSVVPDSPTLDARAYFAVQLMASYLFDAAARLVDETIDADDTRLTKRERQCLELVAQGKDDWAIGRLLQVSSRTAHNHIESAKRRLGVTTRTQAVVEAIARQQLFLGDLRSHQLLATHRTPSLRR